LIKRLEEKGIALFSKLQSFKKKNTRGTSSPFSMISVRVLPRAEPDWTSSLRRSPDER
jgi:hypothetical protein